MQKKKRRWKKLLVTILSAVMIAGNLTGIIGGTVVSAAETQNTLPAAYSSVEKGYTPAVRSQGVFSNCWAHATNACVEISMIKNNVAPADQVNLSESHLIYYFYRPVADPLGGTADDYTTVSAETVYTMFHTGGEVAYVAPNLLSWMGPVAEDDFYDYDYLVTNHNGSEQLEGLNDAEHAYGNRAATVVEAVSISFNKPEDVKKAIMEYGSFAISYNSNSSHFDYTHSSQFSPKREVQNHAVAIVGWDDDFPKENFAETPDGDGAWFVRNSWGAGHGIGGYFWLSYYDATLSNGGWALKAVAPDKYDNNYYYDKATTDLGYVNGVEEGSIEAANIFKIQKEKEILKAVQFGTQWKHLNFSIQIYKNPTDLKRPDTGEALLETPIQGTRAYAGQYTIDFGKNIVLEKDDVIAVAVTYTSDNPLVCPAAQTSNTGVCKEGESVYRVNGGEWKDCNGPGGKNFVIRAFTSNVTEDAQTHQHKFSSEWSTNDFAHWHDCEGSSCCTEENGNGYGAHTGGTPTCKEGAVCDVCEKEYGYKDADNHVGGKVRRNAVAATTTSKGYTGDICCAGCDIVFEQGEEIPMLTPGEGADGTKGVANLDYVFKTLEGEDVSSKVDGKPKMIIFYGAGCGKCVNTMKSFTSKKIEGVDVLAVEVNNGSKEKIQIFKDTLGEGKDNIHFCQDSGGDAYSARIAYEKAFHGMTYSSLPVICYIDENDQINQVTSGQQTLNQIKSNLAVYCKLKTTNLNMENPSDAVFTTLDGEEITLTAEGKPKVVIFFEGTYNSQMTLNSISSENIAGADIYALDVLSQDPEKTKAFVDTYFNEGSNIKVVQSNNAIFEMFEYTDAAEETNSIVYPVIAYIDGENKLQHVTLGESNLAELKINLLANCGYQEPEPPVDPDPEPPVDPDPEPPVDPDPKPPVDPDPKPPVDEEEKVIRVSGATRYETGYKVADTLKETLGIEKFEAVVVATGKNFADALAGSYLAVQKNAPIILTNGKEDNIAQLHEYIAANVAAGGKVYILGGEGAVPETAAAIDGYDVVRLSGTTRYETNLAILDEAGVAGDSIIVATGKTFADSLSASAAKLPILLVKPEKALSEDAKAVLNGMKKIYIIGGEGAVSAEIAAELASYGEVTRISGATRYETSVEVAKTFFETVENAVAASGKNFPDGLCGGPLAAAMNAPLILTADGKSEAAQSYLQQKAIETGIVLGGTEALGEETITQIFTQDK